jgi:hypothetical protein
LSGSAYGEHGSRLKSAIELMAARYCPLTPCTPKNANVTRASLDMDYFFIKIGVEMTRRF